MGMLFSCPESDNDASDNGCRTVTVRSISFKGDDINTILRTLSFSEPETQSSTPKSLRSGSMILEGSLSYKEMKTDQVQLQATFSIINPSVEKENLIEMSGSSKSLQVNGSQVVSQNPCIAHVDNKKYGEDMTASSSENCSVDKKYSVKIASIENSEFVRQNESPKISVNDPDSPKHEAAVKLQKVYKSFRTRRQLADCAVLVEQSWWKLLDFALLKHSSYFDAEKPESIGSRWSRARARAAKVGKGLSKDSKARKLALQHWLEAIDPRHRYGHNLHIYYDSWLHCESKQPFFYWLDVREGKEENLERCPRSKLQQQCIKYLGPKEREAYEVMIEDGKFIYKQTREFVDTTLIDEESKWIFVLSTSKILYVGQKKKGKFQHSSFLAGGATSSAGRLVVEKGMLKAIWPHSGHYRPTEENFQEFVSFLKENNVDLSDVKKNPTVDDEFSIQSGRSNSFRRNLSRFSLSKELTPSETIISNCKEASKLQIPLISDGNANGTVVETLLDPSLEEEEKSCSSVESQASVDATGKEAWSFDHFHASHVQDLTRGSDGESEEDSDFPANGTEEVTENLEAMTAKCDETSLCNLDSDEALQPTRSDSDYIFQKRNLFEEDESQEPEIPRELILKRINSKKGMKSLQLGKQLSFKWTTGAGPRISCVRDYPPELQLRALEQVSLSPRSTGNCKASVSSSPRSIAGQTS